MTYKYGETVLPKQLVDTLKEQGFALEDLGLKKTVKLSQKLDIYLNSLDLLDVSSLNINTSNISIFNKYLIGLGLLTGLYYLDSTKNNQTIIENLENVKTTNTKGGFIAIVKKLLHSTYSNCLTKKLNLNNIK